MYTCWEGHDFRQQGLVEGLVGDLVSQFFVASQTPRCGQHYAGKVRLGGGLVV